MLLILLGYFNYLKQILNWLFGPYLFIIYRNCIAYLIDKLVERRLYVLVTPICVCIAAKTYEELRELAT